MCELARPLVQSVDKDSGAPTLLQTKLDAFSYATSDAAANAAARELVSDALAHVRQDLKLELSTCTEAVELCLRWRTAAWPWGGPCCAVALRSWLPCLRSALSV